MNFTSSWRPLAFTIFAGTLFTVVAFFALRSFSKSQVVPCTDIWASNLILSLALSFALQLVITPRILPGQYKSVLMAHAASILLALWLGLYPTSPLGYSSGKIPILQGFQIIRASRDSFAGVSEIISLPQGSAVGINPIMLPGGFECTWLSSAEGVLDDPASCDTAYIPPDADFDILRLRIRSACGLPDSTAQLKISILP
ncbi:MAG: hypothetical protein AB1649_19220 [Chloroflexota bacterium]